MVTKSPVYFVARKEGKFEQSFKYKLEKIIGQLGLKEEIREGGRVAVKVHFGQEGNTTFIRPLYVRLLVDQLKKMGAKPFVCDTTGVGFKTTRSNKIDALNLAYMHGFNPLTLSCPVVIADGPVGLSGVEVRVNGLLKKAKVAEDIFYSDYIISLAHFKGHPRTGFGGALKNIGLGAVDKETKARIHLKENPRVKREKCNGCMKCLQMCPVKAISMEEGKARINSEKCAWGCGCWEVCPEAISQWMEMHDTNNNLTVKMIDSFSAVYSAKGKENFSFINILHNITPHCDCSPFSDKPVTADIGIMASKDPLSLDLCSLDIVNAELREKENTNFLQKVFEKDYLREFLAQGKPNPEIIEKYGEEKGIGNKEYELIELQL